MLNSLTTKPRNWDESEYIMVQYFKLIGLALVLSVGMGSGASSNSVDVVNEVTELEFSYLNNIPKGPISIDFNVEWPCKNHLIEPETLNGKGIYQKGWRVLSEQTLGPYEFISFAGEFINSTSAMCFFQQGNIAIFKSGKLIGVVYTSSADEDIIGKLQIAEGGIIQLSSSLGMPWVDIRITKDQIKIENRASIQSFCNGTVIIPDVVGKQISEARKSLIEFAWEPIIQTEEVVLSFVERMRQSGIVETIDCGGTGMGYCSFEYESPNATLWVQSAGDEDRVLYHSVSCK